MQVPPNPLIVALDLPDRASHCVSRLSAGW